MAKRNLESELEINKYFLRWQKLDRAIKRIDENDSAFWASELDQIKKGLIYERGTNYDHIVNLLLDLGCRGDW